MATPSLHHQLTEEQTAEFREAFALFDKDGDGMIKLKATPNTKTKMNGETPEVALTKGE